MSEHFLAGAKNDEAALCGGPVFELLRRSLRSDAHLRAAWTCVKVEFSLEPTLVATVMIAIEMQAAMRPYSMAVAPESSCTKRVKVFIVAAPCTMVDSRRSLSGRSALIFDRYDAGSYGYPPRVPLKKMMKEPFIAGFVTMVSG